MKSLLLLSLAITLIPNSMASISELSKEFLKFNTDIQDNTYQVELSHLTLKNELERRDWNFSYSGEYSDSSLERSSFSLIPSTNTTIHSVSLEKGTRWGGKFYFSSSLTDVEYTSSYSQTLSYEQELGANFLGRNNYLLSNSLESDYKAERNIADDRSEQALLKFMTQYLDTALRKTQIKFKEEALERSIKRKNFVSRQVKDGLKEKADLFSSQSNELFAKENLEQAKISYVKSLEKLEERMHRKIETDEIQKLSLNAKFMFEIPSYKIDKNKLLQFSKLNIESLKSSFEAAENKMLPKVSLSGALTTNDYDSKSSGAFSNGTFGSDNNEKKIAIRVSMPLEFRSEKIEKSRAKIKILKAKNKFKKTVQTLKSFERANRQQVELVSKNIDFAKKRIVLSQKTLKEYNRLYSRGRASLDQVLSAEESLISTQERLASYIAQRESIVLTLYHLNSELMELVKQ